MYLLLLVIVLIFIRIIVISIITKKWVQLRITIFILLVLVCLFVLAMYMLAKKGHQVEISRSVSKMNEMLFSIRDLLKEDEKTLDIFLITGINGRFLTDKEFADLQSSYMQSAGFRFPEYDKWENRFEIHYTRSNEENVKLSVISKGPDGIIGTKDDLIVSKD